MHYGSCMMTVYKRGDSKFYWVRLERKGHVLQESSGKTTRREAKLKEAELRLQHWPELEGGTEMPTLSEFTRELFPYWTRELKPNTRKYYSESFRALLTFDELDNARLDEITPKLIERYKQFREKNGAGLVTVQHSLRALRRALRLAVDVFEHKFVPPKIKLRKEPQRDYVVSEADFQRLIANCGRPAQQIAPKVNVRADSGKETLQALFTTLFDCGLRAGEACHLTWDRVNLEERWLFVDVGKTKAARRRIPLTSRVVAVLEGLKAKARPNVPHVFTRHGGHQPLTPGWASHEFGRIRKLLGLPDGCVLHSLRHSFATRLGNKGCSTGDLMKICGWETPAIAVRYTHLDAARMETIVGFLEPEGSLR
jgi:integrase